MDKNIPVTIAKGDGIGPSIMDATLRILRAAGAKIIPEEVVVGEKAYKNGIETGISSDAWKSIRTTKILLKAPLTTPQGEGYKSVNVTLRKKLGLFANIRPVRTFQPFVVSKHDAIDMVIIRENEEDLYTGIEYRQSADSCQGLKMVSASGTERFIRYAFEYARVYNRKKVTCMVKDNIMKMTDGLFHKIFDKIAKEYPSLESETIIVDIGMALVADKPERFDVLVTMNLYGDIVSDVASQVAGSVGLAGSANIGGEYALFEAIHGSAPDIAGKGIANPSGLLNAAILMLRHIGQADIARKIENAWLCALEDGCHTADIITNNKKPLNTTQFADAVIARLGKKPQKLISATKGEYSSDMLLPTTCNKPLKYYDKKLVGVDIYVDWQGKSDELGAQVTKAGDGGLSLSSISSRGTKVYPSVEHTEIIHDLWCCRFMSVDNAISKHLLKVLANLDQLNIEWVKVENLYTFDGEEGFSQI